MPLYSKKNVFSALSISSILDILKDEFKSEKNSWQI